MLQKFGGNDVSIDGTHGTNAYDLTLNSLLIIDEFGSGFPVAWCLSNHEDATAMRIFFDVLKRACGRITPKWFMSDMANQYYNAWVAVMENRPIKLVCTWHVDKAWKENLRQKIRDECSQGEVYQMLRTIVEHTDETSFEDDMNHMIDILQCDESTTDFCSYFVEEWLPRKHEWAYCHRIGLGINTNMFVEAFHRAFKHVYLKGKVNRRVDSCLFHLLKYISDKMFERLIKLMRGKMTSRVKDINVRHRSSERLLSTSVSNKGKYVWEVMSEKTTGRFYTVKRLATVCPNRDYNLKCQMCGNTCVHTLPVWRFIRFKILVCKFV